MGLFTKDGITTPTQYRQVGSRNKINKQLVYLVEQTDKYTGSPTIDKVFSGNYPCMDCTASCIFFLFSLYIALTELGQKFFLLNCINIIYISYIFCIIYILYIHIYKNNPSSVLYKTGDSAYSLFDWFNLDRNGRQQK